MAPLVYQLEAMAAAGAQNSQNTSARVLTPAGVDATWWREAITFLLGESR